MVDNVDITPGTGATVAADLVGGALHQRVKISQGADGVAADVSSTAPLEVTLANTAANSTAVKVNVASGGIASGGIASGAVASGAVASGAFASGAVGSGAIASGAVASGAVASGAFAAGAMADGANVTLGTKTDAKSTATDGTSTSLISIEKQVSASVQAISTALGSTALDLGSGTGGTRTLRTIIDSSQFAALGQGVMTASQPVVVASDQSAIAVKTASAAIASGSIASGAVASGAYASGSIGSGAIASGAVASGAYASGSIGSGAIASGAIASGAVASGAVASGAYASGSISDGADVTFGAKADAKNAATDTTSITAMSVFKQISASVQTIAAPGLNSRVSVTRPSNTNTYGAGDVLGPTGGGTASITFALGAVSASNIMITSARLQRNVTAVISGETTYRLHFFNATQPGAQVDEDTFTVAAGDQAAYLGYITFPQIVDVGATLHSNLENINKQVKLGATTSLFGVLETVGSYVAASASVLVVDISAIQL